jgi:hypothetical protein
MRSAIGEGVAAQRSPAYSEAEMTSPVQPQERPTHSGRLLVRMPQSLHSALALTAEREGVSLNTLITGALAGAVGWRGDEAVTAEQHMADPPAPASNPFAPARDARAAGRWTAVALRVNAVLVALAAIAAIVLLVMALVQG